MIDVNLPIRKALKSILSNINYNSTTVPVYYNQSPEKAPVNHIIIRPITNKNTSTINSSDVETDTEIEVSTYNDKYNDGVACSTISGQILIALDNQTLDMSTDLLNHHGCSMISDREESWTIDNQRVYINRILTFRHNIFIL